jgi:hypothetical protein
MWYSMTAAGGYDVSRRSLEKLAKKVITPQQADEDLKV